MEPISLGALWASLPDLAEAGVLPGSTRLTTLMFLPENAPARRPRATVLIHSEMPGGSALITRFGEIMADYPSAVGWAVPMKEDSIRPPALPGGAWQFVVRWPAVEAQPEMSEDELKPFYDKVAPEYRYRGDRFLRPGVDAAKSMPPSPLMTWWLLLYSFSILARYEPRRWARLLDLDTSKVAAMLQYALEEAITVVPHLVLEALDGEPRPLPKPIAF